MRLHETSFSVETIKKCAVHFTMIHWFMSLFSNRQHHFFAFRKIWIAHGIWFIFFVHLSLLLPWHWLFDDDDDDWGQVNWTWAWIPCVCTVCVYTVIIFFYFLLSTLWQSTNFILTTNTHSHTRAKHHRINKCLVVVCCNNQPSGMQYKHFRC